MSTRFLTAFAEALVAALVAEELVALAPGATPASAAAELAGFLGTRTFGAQLVPSVVAGLVAAPAVEELYADDDRVRELIEALPPTSLPR
jgi:hypothetical protein